MEWLTEVLNKIKPKSRAHPINQVLLQIDEDVVIHRQHSTLIFFDWVWVVLWYWHLTFDI